MVPGQRSQYQDHQAHRHGSGPAVPQSQEIARSGRPRDCEISAPAWAGTYHRIAAGRPLILGGVHRPVGLRPRRPLRRRCSGACHHRRHPGRGRAGRYRHALSGYRPAWKGADSLQFLRHACNLVEQRGFRSCTCRFDGDPGAAQAEGLPDRHPPDRLRKPGCFPGQRLRKIQDRRKGRACRRRPSAEAQAVVTLTKMAS